MQFNFTYAKGLTLDQIKGFEIAGKIWSAYLKDNVTINIAVDIQKDFPGNAIAGAAPRLNTQKFDQFAKALESDAISADDRLALQTDNLVNKSFTGRFNNGNGNGNGNQNGNGGNGNNESRDSNQLNLNSANAKALGLDLKGNDSLLDGYVVMRDLKGTGVNWDFDFARTGNAPAKTLDFLSVAIHEIGHILGFQSSVDRPGWVDPKANNGKPDDFKKNLDDRAKSVTPLDLFRFSDRSKLDPDKNGTRPVVVDLAMGGNPFLSLRNGNNPVAAFDTGTDKSQGGSGNQASHWKTSGVMNAVINQGNRPGVSVADLTALDVIGYNLALQGINTPINYSQLLQQVTQALAQRIGKTPDWLNANPIAIANLTKDVTEATSEMLDNSTVYKKKDLSFWSGGARGERWWQGFKQTFMEEGLFESLGNEFHDHDHEELGDLAEIADLLTGFNSNSQHSSCGCGCCPKSGSREDSTFTLSGTSFDSLTGMVGLEQVSNTEPIDNSSLELSFGGNLLENMIIDQFPGALDIGSIGAANISATIYGSGMIASWLQQNNNSLSSLNLLENSLYGSNPVFDLAGIT